MIFLASDSVCFNENNSNVCPLPLMTKFINLRMHSSNSLASKVGRQALLAELFILVMLCIGLKSRI